MKLNCTFLLSQLSLLIYTENNKIVGGLLGGEYDFTEMIKEGLLNICQWMVEGLFNFLSPFILYGCKFTIVASLVIFVASHDQKYISTGVKSFLIMIIFLLMKAGVDRIWN